MNENVGYFASILNGREYGKELSKHEEQIAKNNKIVIVFGWSDDCMEFRGAINSEISCWEGASVFVGKIGGDIELIESKCSCGDNCPYFQELNKKGFEIKAIWGGKEDYSWNYETEIPHKKFDIVEDECKYCEGIVFCLDDVEDIINARK